MNSFAFTTIDFIVIGIIASSAILGLIRGFIREAFSFVGFAVAMYVAYHFSGVIASKWFTTLPGGLTGQHALAFIGVFVAVFLNCFCFCCVLFCFVVFVVFVVLCLCFY